MFEGTYYRGLLDVKTKEGWCENVLALGQNKIWKGLWIKGTLFRETVEKRTQ